MMYPGETVLAVMNCKGTLTVGKSYILVNRMTDDEKKVWVTVINNSGNIQSYPLRTFITKKEWKERNLKVVGL